MNALFKCVFILGAAVAAHGFNMGDQDVVFHCFSRENSQVSEPLLPSVNSIMLSTCLSLTRKTIVTIHSFDDNVGGNFNAFVIPAHLSAEDVNLIAVDWRSGAAMYTQALSNAPQAGQVIASFLNILIETFAYNSNLVRIVGVGIGGHIAGIAARNVVTEIPSVVGDDQTVKLNNFLYGTNSEIAKKNLLFHTKLQTYSSQMYGTVIDPALPGWTHHPQILNPDDADVVEVLHTTAGVFGYDYPLGDLDFYPNGGTSQPGCGNSIDCSHTFAYAFYAESLTAEADGGNKFVGTACEDYEQAIALQCAGERDVTFGGTAFKTGASGIYTFLTNTVPPFARG